MSNERDELAYLIRGEAVCSTGNAKDAADALIEMGYRKPRTITTVEELDALPEDSVVLDKELAACQKEMPGVWCAGAELIMSELVELPATVLWEPQP